ncbi:uncharacterized protein LOC110108594 isoform X1 [Dendrobium catenatum]|uniref:uncharacterized protein LOC110108594 isoform X1 n=1 Tax=Dendrobium catenatum TaxID=906689 RepID=UPI0009F1C27B|nr:uncharacterized protein LOC110108594 isoform X1 [Dendrobium catenatum]
MKGIVSPTLIFKLSHSAFSHLHPTYPCSHLLLLHSTAGDDVYRRRSDGSSALSSSSPSSFSSSSLSRRNYDDENRNVKITVWWDFENCSIPVGVNVHRVSNRITWAIRSCGIKGPVTITAFGDVAQLSRATQEALTSTGVCLSHVPCSGKNSSDRSFMADIVYWVYQNPPPAHFFLISGDKDFANILHRLRMSNYNILLASTDTASAVLCSAATIMWPWNGLVRGENVTVRHFNHPPDGLYGSWYGHYKGVLDDPFADTDHPTTSQPEESMESISESKPRPVPRVVVNAIRQILHSYPEGISLTELRSELKRNNITMDKDFFGYKKFSLFLASLNLLKFIPPLSGDRHPLVVGTLKKGVEQTDIRARSTKEVYTNGIYKDNGFTRKGDLLMEKASISTEPSSRHKDSKLDANSSASILSKVDDPLVDLEAHKVSSVPQPNILDPSDNSLQRDSIEATDGFLKKLWKTLTGHRVGSVHKKDDNSLVVDSSRHEDSSKNAPSMRIPDNSKQIKPKDEAVDLNNLLFEKESSEIHSLGSEKSVAKDNDTWPSEKSDYVHEQRVGLFGRIVRWSKFLIYGANGQDDHSDSSDKVHQIHELFSKTHFWDELESFLLDPKSCHLILKSRTREQLLRRLQNEGPPSLKELDYKDLCHLGDILLWEKKWLEESASHKFPFKLVITPKKKSVTSQPFHSNGLSSLFPGKTKSNLQKQQDQEKQEQNLVSMGMSQNGTSPPCNFSELRFWFQKTFGSTGNVEPDEFLKLFENKFNTKLFSSSYGYPNIQNLIAACSTGTNNASGKTSGPPSRDEILSDCRKLLKELLEKNPTGFNISNFQPEFVRKYNYILDYQTLGYPKLLNLLQIMASIRIENSYIRPSEILHSEPKELKEDSKDEDDKGKEALMENSQFDDSSWDELGPLSSYPRNENGKEYRPVSLSDDEYSDSEEEDIHLRSDRSGNSQQSLEDSSLLLKILDSWDSSKEGKDQFRRESDGKEKHRDINGLVDCSRNTYQKKPSNIGTGSLQNLKSTKSSSFVTQVADDRESFAERILGEVKKAGDLRLKG